MSRGADFPSHSNVAKDDGIRLNTQTSEHKVRKHIEIYIPIYVYCIYINPDILLHIFKHVRNYESAVITH